MKRIGACNRCGLCCGDNDNGWCEFLVGRPPDVTSCSFEGYPKPCGDNGNWPYSPDVALPAGCTYRWEENGD